MIFEVAESKSAPNFWEFNMVEPIWIWFFFKWRQQDIFALCRK